MTIVRGILMGLVLCLAATAVPAHAAAPEASAQVDRQGAKNNWEIIKEWKKGVVRGCRSEWDGQTFDIKVQLVNRAERGSRGATTGIRSTNFPDWSNRASSPVGPGKKALLIDGTVTAERPRRVDVRAKVAKGEQKSGWSKVLRVDRMNIC